jgi:acetolactate synthase-1/2/3 large subunit
MRYSAISEEHFASDAIAAALAEGGVEYVFGMAGGLTGNIWSSLKNQPSIRALQVREESIGSVMAEAYGRLTGKPADIMGQGEWIVGNAGQAYMEALLGSSPLVILTEMSDGGPLSHHGPYQSGTGDYGNWDARTALSGVTKRVMISYTPAQAVQHTQLALKHAMTGEPGPVAVVFHSLSLRGRVGPTTVPRIFHTGAYLPQPQRSVDEVDLKTVAGVLRHAKQPVIVAGNGVRLSAGRVNLQRLAQILDAPVATTASGKGVFPEDDPLAVGVMGTFGWASANAVVAEADVVIALGTKLGPNDTVDENTALLDPERQILIQVDVEPLNVGWTYPVDHSLIGDADFVMERLANELESSDVTRGDRSGRTRAADAMAIDAHRIPFSDSATATPMSPKEIVSIVSSAFPDDGVVTCDAGENRLFMMQWFCVSANGEYLQPAAGGGMGYSVPAAMAAKLVHPARPVLAVCGDGGFSMNLHSLMTAVDEHLPIGVLILNNGVLGWVLHGMGTNAVPDNWTSFDYAGIARSIGCDGVRVESGEELRTAIKSLGDLSKPLIIEVATSLDTSFADVASEFSSSMRKRTGY